MFRSIFPSVVRSARSGTLDTRCSPSHRSPAAFFAPLMVTSPFSFLPPLMTMVFIVIEKSGASSQESEAKQHYLCFLLASGFCLLTTFFEQQSLGLFLPGLSGSPALRTCRLYLPSRKAL